MINKINFSEMKINCKLELNKMKIKLTIIQLEILIKELTKFKAVTHLIKEKIY